MSCLDCSNTSAPDLSVSDDPIKADLDIRAQLLSMPCASVPSIDGIYDFSFLKAAISELNVGGWKPKA